jgi:hypothetical protein
MSVATQPGQGVVHGDRIEDYDGLRLLLSDIRVMGKLVNRARYLTVERLFGVGPDDSVLVSVIALWVLADAAKRSAAKVLSGPPVPEFGDALLGSAGMSSLARGIGGPSSATVPNFAGLVALAVVATSVRPAATRAWHGLRLASHDTRLAFDHRYGHIFRRHHRHPSPAPGASEPSAAADARARVGADSPPSGPSGRG